MPSVVTSSQPSTQSSWQPSVGTVEPAEYITVFSDFYGPIFTTANAVNKTTVGTTSQPSTLLSFGAFCGAIVTNVNAAKQATIVATV